MRVWDLPTRLYHWLQAMLFVGLIVTGNTGQGPHAILGLLMLTLLMWRILWGVVGSQTSRFAQFVQSPRAVTRYFKGVCAEKAGHNPAGGWMVVIMLSVLLAQCFSGVVIAGFADDIVILQPLLTDSKVEAIAIMHGGLARVLPVLIAFHLIAILVYKLRSRPLVLAMITGIQESTDTNAVRFESNKRAALMLCIAVSLTVVIVV